jgi:hypothetical protein
MIRPSARCATMCWSVTSTAVTLGSAPRLFGCAAVLTPRLHDAIPVENDNAADDGEFSRCQTMVRRQPHRIKPELARRPIPASVDMRRLATIEAVEEQPKCAGNVGNGRHAGEGRQPRRLARIESSHGVSRQREALKGETRDRRAACRPHASLGPARVSSSSNSGCSKIAPPTWPCSPIASWKAPAKWATMRFISRISVSRMFVSRVSQ